MVERYEGSCFGQGRSVTLPHWYLGQCKRDKEKKEEEINEVMKIIEMEVWCGAKDGRMKRECRSVPSLLH